MPSVGFEPTISAGERPQIYPFAVNKIIIIIIIIIIYALDRAATGTCIKMH